MGIVYRLANLNWVAVVFSPLAVILMEVFCVFPWLVWVGNWSALVWQRPPLSLASLIFLLGASFFINKFFLSRRWALKWIKLCIVSCGLVAIFLVVRVEYGAGFGLMSGQWFVQTTQIFLGGFSRPHPAVIAVPVGVYLWWRGISRGRSPLYFNDIYPSFLVGLTALVILVVVWGSGSGAGSFASLTSTVGLHVAGFFFFGLTALALGNLSAIRERMTEKEGVALVFSQRWLYILLGVVGGIVLVGIGVASMLSTDLVALLAQWLDFAAGLLLQVLYYLLIPVGYLVAGLVYAARFILSLLGSGQYPQPSQPSDSSELDRWREEAVLKTLSPEAVLVIKWCFFVIVTAAVVFLLAKAVSRYWPSRERKEIQEINESLWSWDVFKADLGLFLSIIWQKFKRKRRQPVPVAPIPVWYADEDIPGCLDVREIYRHLLWEAACSGIARSSHETAYEYAERLGRAVPNGSEQLTQLTALYVEVRYGDLKTPDRQVDSANSLWRFLRELLRRLRGP